MSTAGPKTERMRKIALALPETTEEVTWGTDVNFRVRKKIFLFPGEDQMTIKTDPDSTRGSRPSRKRSACTPPTDAPMTTTSRAGPEAAQ